MAKHIAPVPPDEYQVFDKSGNLVLGAPASCRYPNHFEQSILEAGYTIRLHRKKLSRKNENEVTKWKTDGGS